MNVSDKVRFEEVVECKFEGRHTLAASLLASNERGATIGASFSARAHRAWRNAERIKRLSDDLLRIGPWGLGLDGVLAWVPIANTAYSIGAGGLLLYEALRAQAAPWTVTRMIAYLAANSVMTEVPLIGWAMDTLFRGHLMAANALQKDIVSRYGAPETWPAAEMAPERAQPPQASP